MTVHTPLFSVLLLVALAACQAHTPDTLLKESTHPTLSATEQSDLATAAGSMNRGEERTLADGTRIAVLAHYTAASGATCKELTIYKTSGQHSEERACFVGNRGTIVAPVVQTVQ